VADDGVGDHVGNIGSDDVASGNGMGDLAGSTSGSAPADSSAESESARASSEVALLASVSEPLDGSGLSCSVFWCVETFLVDGHEDMRHDV
jgi:hypothetical protein